MRVNGFVSAVVAVLLPAVAAAGPYAPAAGQSGSTAIDKDDDDGTWTWATGYINYLPGTAVDPTWQTPEKALGPAAGNSYDIVGLGRGGEITLTFSTPIADGLGWDFAVFENSFSDTFLELAWVEVSSDGTNFVPFPAFSIQGIDLSDPTNRSKDTPVGGFGAVDPTNIDGFADKYRQGFGTPFDLGLFAGIPELEGVIDLNSITHVKLVDIVGDGNTFDNSPETVEVPGLGEIPWGPFPIYDPYPTSGAAGFDLDAIAVLNAGAPIPGVPIPPAVWLLGTALAGLAFVSRRRG